MYASIMLKYGPWRCKLRCIYQKETKKRQWQAWRTSLSSRARFVLHVLQTLAREMHGQDDRSWSLNVGHNIGFCTGPVPFLTSWGVIAAAKPGPTPALIFGKQKKRKRLRTGASEVASSCRKLMKIALVADALAGVSAPRTCKDWITTFDTVISMNQEAKKIKTLKVLQESLVVRSPRIR